MGGIAALIMAATFVVFAVVNGAILMPAGYLDAGIDPVQKATIVVDNQYVLSMTYLLSFVIFGVFLVVLTLALHDRLKAADLEKTRTATAFGLIFAGLAIASGMVATIGIRTVVDLYESDPAQAGVVWAAIESVQLGLGATNEIVGGLWILLVSWVALQAGKLPKILNYLGGVIGFVGLLVLVLPLNVVGPLFGPGLIIWFVWIGIVLLLSSSRPAA